MKYHEDNICSWLEVPIAKLEELGIEKEISTYSHIDKEKGLAYLYRSYDPDCDVELFINHCADFDWDKLESVESERSFIRDLESYTRFELTGLETLLLTVKKLSQFGFSINVSINEGCVVYGSHEELDTAVNITIEESSISVKVNRISNLDTILSKFRKKIENPARKDLEQLIFKCCYHYHP